MRATFLFITSFLLCHSFAQGSTFIFKSGKSVQGEIRHEDASTIRILESSGLEMTLRKSELNLPATTAANLQQSKPVAAPATEPQAEPTRPARSAQRKVFTNRDVRGSRTVHFSPPAPESKQAWQKAVAKLEREFIRLQGACRGAGTGPGLSKVLRSQTYTVNGKQVRVTGYFADPANIEEAKQICARAIATEEELQNAREGFQSFLNSATGENFLSGR